MCVFVCVCVCIFIKLRARVYVCVCVCMFVYSLNCARVCMYMCVQVADEHHWPEMRAFILVASAEKKDTSSTAGESSSCYHAIMLSCYRNVWRERLPPPASSPPSPPPFRRLVMLSIANCQYRDIYVPTTTYSTAMKSDFGKQGVC